jgi:hypothetical protein
MAGTTGLEPKSNPDFGEKAEVAHFANLPVKLVTWIGRHEVQSSNTDWQVCSDDT